MMFFFGVWSKQTITKAYAANDLQNTKAKIDTHSEMYDTYGFQIFYQEKYRCKPK